VIDIFTKGPDEIYFRADREVIRVPEGHSYGQVRRIAVDSAGRIYIAQRDLRADSLPPVTVYEADGTYVGGFGHGLFSGLHGIFVTPDDFIFLVDTERHQIFKCRLDGSVVLVIGSRLPSFGGPFNHPSDVTVSPYTGLIYVADGDGNTRVHVFAPDGTHLRSWGEPGKSPGQFATPHSIAVDAEERVYVGDRDTGRILIFTSEGEFVTEWHDILHRPAALYMDQQSQILYVADTICRVHMYDTNGVVRGRAHSAAPPHSVFGDGEGSIYFCFPDGNLHVEKWTRIDPAVANEATGIER
jgi:DNA-binding beta-propeller fold protein YncE